MSDATTLTGSALARTDLEPRVYRDARAVKARAAVTRPDDSPAFARALARLDQALASGRPLSRDVPRGYYLNIHV